MSRSSFELHGAKVTERGVQTVRIVPTFDVLEDSRASLSTCLKLDVGAFRFESAEEAFHRRIVEATAPPAHADLAMEGSQGL